MKTLFTLIALLTFCMAEGQYFQQRFNLDYTTPALRNERCNSGIRTRDNYMAGNPALHYYAGIGTSYNNTALAAPNNVADRMRFQQLNNTGVTVISNLGYQFADAATAPWYHSYGNGIAEVNNAAHNGGYVTVGTVANNTITGAAAIAGGSDALFTQLDAGGAVISSVRYDILGGFTTFAIVAPATSNMLITKLTAAAGAIMFQNVLRVSSGGNFYTSKCYDIIETAGPQYFLAGPMTRGGVNYEMMYKTNAAGIGINWYRYNRMNYNVGFGLDNVNTAANAGVAYFASMQNPANVAFSDSHIMKTDYFGRTCNFCTAYPPNNAPLQMEVHPRNRLQQPTAQTRRLVSAAFKYSNILICNQAVIICGAAVAATSAEAATTLEKTGVAKLFPNPVINVLHVQFNTPPAGEYNLSLTDINGRTILQKNNVHNNGKSFTDIDMSSFAPGIYMLTIKMALLLQ